jgi:hypothetical protein
MTGEEHKLGRVERLQSRSNGRQCLDALVWRYIIISGDCQNRFVELVELSLVHNSYGLSDLGG